VSAIYDTATESRDQGDGDKLTRDLAVAFQDDVGRQRRHRKCCSSRRIDALTKSERPLE
jgi:hypothetical protein